MMGGNACGKPGKAPQAFFYCYFFFKGETDRRPIRGTLWESGSATVRGNGALRITRPTNGNGALETTCPTMRASPAEAAEVEGQV